MQLNSLSALGQMAILNMNIHGLNGNVCVDAAATHAISEAVLYHILKDQGFCIQKTYLTMTLAYHSLSQLVNPSLKNLFPVIKQSSLPYQNGPFPS
ncbi:hypothetical protein CEXT_289681 [Caerostris extrusa]|uniref:Uncharacterized protein n=1 Tax=Caerostris extrusa TaxID=172846 RepID=A0AAV4VMZ1_CAEEX|nr:hypothetical protein CEXT_289681 [Caerostris extrusa]